MKNTWHITRNPEGIILSRHIPARFDFSLRTELPHASPVRLAHQIRQDLWRALRRVRGFSPVVELQAIPTGWTVVAGGRVTGRVAPSVIRNAECVLEDKENRSRWLRCAGGLA